MTATAAPNDVDFAQTLEAVEGQVAKVRVTGVDEPYQGKVAQAADKDGVRRFKVGRRIVSVDTITEVAIDVPASDGGTAEVPVDPAPTPAAPKPPAEKVVLTSGKEATGKTLTIRCAWVDPDKRTKKQQELFDTGFKGVEKGKSYEAMVKAAGNGAKKDEAMPDGAERVIKVQDAFQVRFSIENQKKHRNALRRAKGTAKKAAREAAKTAATA